MFRFSLTGIARYRRALVLTASALLAAASGLAGSPAAQASTPTISLVSLAPGVTEAGMPYSATLVVQSTGSITVQAILVAVRDSSGHNLDFPGSVSATINGTYVYTSEFGSYELNNTWYPLAKPQTLTVTAAPSSGTPNPPPLKIPGTWTSSLNDGPHYDSSTGGVSDSVSGILGWNGATGGLQHPHNSYEDDCYNPANVTLDPSGDYVDLSLTDPTASQCARVQPSGWDTETYYGAEASSLGAFEQQNGAFEAEVYLPATPTGTTGAGTIADWPGFFLSGDKPPPDTWSNTGEIDLVEGLGGGAQWHFHYGPVGDSNLAVGGPGGIGPGWHTFGVDWQLARDTSFPEQVITYQWDGKYVATADEPGTSGELTPTTMYLAFNMTHNANNGLTIPAAMWVAYARAWTCSYGAVPLSIDSNAVCLDDYSSGTTSPTKVDVWTCNGTGAQSWNVESNETIVSALGGSIYEQVRVKVRAGSGRLQDRLTAI